MTFREPDLQRERSRTFYNIFIINRNIFIHCCRVACRVARRVACRVARKVACRIAAVRNNQFGL